MVKLKGVWEQLVVVLLKVMLIFAGKAEVNHKKTR
jgi:hypothetical protein